MIQIGGLCFGGYHVHLFHLFLLPHFAPKCRWGNKEKPLIMIDYQRFSLFYHLCEVIRLGLEPKTPTLKVLCSTC